MAGRELASRVADGGGALAVPAMGGIGAGRARPTAGRWMMLRWCLWPDHGIFWTIVVPHRPTPKGHLRGADRASQTKAAKPRAVVAARIVFGRWRRLAARPNEGQTTPRPAVGDFAVASQPPAPALGKPRARPEAVRAGRPVSTSLDRLADDGGPWMAGARKGAGKSARDCCASAPERNFRGIQPCRRGLGARRRPGARRGPHP